MIELIEPERPKIAVLQIELPYPPAELNPNRHQGRGWFAYRAMFNRYKSDSYYMALQAWNAKQRGKIKYGLLNDGDFPMKLTFVHGDPRPDADNILAASKAGLDGLAAALKINDDRFDPLIVTRRHIEHMNVPHTMLIAEFTCQQSS